MISLIHHDSSEGEQWGRYNLPRSIHFGSPKLREWKRLELIAYDWHVFKPKSGALPNLQHYESLKSIIFGRKGTLL